MKVKLNSTGKQEQKKMEQNFKIKDKTEQSRNNFFASATHYAHRQSQQTLTGLCFITTNDVILSYFRFVLVLQSHTKEQTSLLFGLQGPIAGRGVRCICQQGGRCHDLMLEPKLRLLSSVPICLGTSAEKQG